MAHLWVSDHMPLDHNQWAVVAIVSTLCLAGVYTVVDSGISTTETGGFEPATDDLSPTQIDATFTEGEDTDGDGTADNYHEKYVYTHHSVVFDLPFEPYAFSILNGYDLEQQYRSVDRIF